MIRLENSRTNYLRLGILLSLFALIFPLSEINAQTVTVTIPDVTAAAGKEVNLDILASNLTGLQVYSFDFTLIFDASLLQALEVSSAGSIAAPWGNPTVNILPGRVDVAFAGVDPLTGSGKLLRVRFHVVESAALGKSSPLSFMKFKFNEGQPPITMQNGNFHVGQDLEAPVLVSGPTIVETNFRSVKISLQTDEPSTVVLNFGETSAYGETVSDAVLNRSHILQLNNLRETTGYHYQIQLTDSLHNGPRISSDYTFRSKNVNLTLPAVTIDPGEITQIPVTIPDCAGLNITKIQLEILFDPVQFQVTGIGTANTVLANWPPPQVGIANGKLTILAEHTAPLTGGGVLFYLKGSAPASAVLNQPSNLSWGNVNFNDGQIILNTTAGSLTVKDRLPPLITAGPEVKDLGSHSAVILWQTNELSTSRIEFGETSTYSLQLQQAELIPRHELSLVGLSPGTLYHYRVGGSDRFGNGPGWSSDAIFTTLPAGVTVGFPDTTVAVGSTLLIPLKTSTVTENSIFSWHCIVGYDPQKLEFSGIQQTTTLTQNWPPVQVTANTGFVSLIASGPTPLTGAGPLIYLNFKVLIAGDGQNQSEIALLGFRYDDGWPAVATHSVRLTLIRGSDQQPPQFIWGPFVDAISNNSARIFWRTSELATAEVNYGTATNYGSTAQTPQAGTFQQINLTGLQPNTQYHFRVQARDLAGNLSGFTTDNVFSTLAGNSIAVGIPNLTAAPGETVDLPIQVGDLTNLGVFSCDLELAFDPTLVSVLSVSSAGCLAATWGDPVFSIFTDRVVVAMGGIQTLQGIGNLVKIRLQVSASASAGEQTQIRFVNFIFNEGSPLATYRFGRLQILDRIPPKLLAGPVALNVSANSAFIAWQTDELADSRITYGINSPDEAVLVDKSLHLAHVLFLDNLQPVTTYHVRIAARDSSGNEWLAAQTYDFTTLTQTQLTFTVGTQQGDINQLVQLPLTISGIGSRMIFTLDFDLIFDPQLLEYRDVLLAGGGIADWNSEVQALAADRVKVHLQGNHPIIQDGVLLQFQFFTKSAPYNSTSPVTLENFFVNGDSSNVQAQAGLFQLVDRTPPTFLGQPVVSQIRVNSVAIAWQTDEPTLGSLIYGVVGETPDTVFTSSFAAVNNYTLVNLESATAYRFQIGIVDADGNGPSWSDWGQFVTTSGNEIDVILPDTTLAIGDTVLIPIRIGTLGGTPISSYSFSMFVPPQALGFLQSIKNGSLTASWQTADARVVADSLILTHSGSQPLSGSGTLLFLRFTIHENVKHHQRITLRFNRFVFNNGEPPAAVTNGSILCQDKRAPRFLSPPAPVAIHLKSAAIQIRTDEPSRVKLRYDQTVALSQTIEIAAFDTLHIVPLTNLAPGQNYFYQVEATDSLANGPTVSTMQSFRTVQSIIRITIPDTTIATNSDFDLPIRISDISDFAITQYNLEFGYDNRVLAPLGITTENSLSSNWGNGAFNSNAEKVTFSHSGTTALTGDGVLFRLQFHLAQSAQIGDSTKIQLTQTVFQNGFYPASAKEGFIRFKAGAATSDVQVALPDTAVYTDTRFVVGLHVSDVTHFDIRSYSFIFSFDQQFLELESTTTQNTLTKDWPNPTKISFGDSLFFGHSGTTVLAGDGDLLQFHFYAKSGLSSGQEIELKLMNFKFNEGKPNANVENGKVSIIVRPSQITGYVRNQLNPQIIVAGAQVFALDSTRQQVASAVSDANGFFKLGGLDWRKHYQVCATKTGYSPADTLKNLVPSTSTITLNLLKQDGVIAGQLQNAENQPVTTALVVANDQQGHFGSANSNVNGEFRIENLDRRNRYQVTLTKYGYVTSKIANVAVDSILQVKLNWAYGSVVGQVLDPTNQPLAGVLIKIFYQNDGLPLTQLVTATDGRFSQDSLKADAYLVTAQKFSFLSLPKQAIFNLTPLEEKQLEFHMKPYQLAAVQITGESFIIPNDSPTQFSYTAISDSNETIDELQNPVWKLLPTEAGTVIDGNINPDSSFIGAAVLILSERNTTFADTVSLTFYANIQPQHSSQLHDDSGLELSIPEQSTDRTFQLIVEMTQPQSIKGSTRAYQVIGSGYDFKPDGIQFLEPVTIRLPIPEQYQNDALSIGHWDPTRAEWTILPESNATGTAKIETTIEHLSLYALLLPSKPLGIHQVEFTPNPFSPEIDSDGDGRAGVKISFSVTSKTIRQPFVTIKIYSLLGELVRELSTNAPLEKGRRYDFFWDGRTELSREARNGRYLVQIEAKDEQGIETYLGQVVLVK